jgi:hypothetical protein
MVRASRRIAFCSSLGFDHIQMQRAFGDLSQVGFASEKIFAGDTGTGIVSAL